MCVFMNRRGWVTQFQQDRTGGGEILPKFHHITATPDDGDIVVFGEWAVSVGLHTATVA